MKWTKWMGALLIAMFALQTTAFSQREGAGARSFHVSNRVRVEWDDNVNQTSTNEQDSVKIIEELEFLVNLDLQQTFVSLRYRPTFTWWDDRPSDDTDLHHDLDLVLNHEFTPRLTLSIVESFRLAELPELVDRGTVVRENDDYIYNTVNGTVIYSVSDTTQLEAGGRYVILRYDEDILETDDYDLLVGGLTLRRILNKSTTLSGDFRFETIDYDASDRGSDTIYIGGGVEHVFTPQMLGSLRAGFQDKEFDDATIGSESTPFGDLVVTFVPAAATRVSAGIGFSFYETDVPGYANQERTRLFLSLSHDLTAKIALHLSGSYTEGDYDANQAEAAAVAPVDGTEEIILVSARVAYRVNRSNWIEAGWQYTDLDTDLRESYDRNRLNVGWKTAL